MPPFKNNEDWFIRQPKEYQEYIFQQFDGNFQAFLAWCAEPYKNSLRGVEIRLKQN